MSNEENNIEEGVQNKPFSVIQYLEDNSRNLLYAGIALLVIAGGIWYYTSVYTPAQEAAANDEMYQAEKYFELDSIDLALNGNGADVMGLRDIADEYGSTKNGERAKYLTARGLMDKGEFEEALEYIESVSFDDEIVAALAVCLEADCYVELDDVEKGAELYMKAAKVRTNEFTTPYSLNKAAIAYTSIGEHEKALKAYEAIKKDYNNTQYSANIEKFIARAEAAAAAK